MSGRRPAKINVISARFSNEELDLIKVKAHELGMTHTAYIQMMATSKRLLQPIATVAIIDPVRLLMHKELRQQGVNLNQIARAINTANLEGVAVNGYLKVLNQIRDKNTELSQSLIRLEDKL